MASHRLQGPVGATASSALNLATSADGASTIDEALARVRSFGADIAAHPSAAEVQAEFDAVWQELGSRPIEALATLPLVSDPEQRALMQALSTPLEAAFLTDPSLYHLLLRVAHAQRAEVFRRLSSLAPPPAGVGGPQVLRMDPRALETWRSQLVVTW